MPNENAPIWKMATMLLAGLIIGIVGQGVQNMWVFAVQAQELSKQASELSEHRESADSHPVVLSMMQGLKDDMKEIKELLREREQ